MSEREQRTAAKMRSKMLTYYGEEHYHKHNKNHLHNPPHKKIQVFLTLNKPSELLTEDSKWSAKSIQDFKGRKTRKRLDKGDFH